MTYRVRRSGPWGQGLRAPRRRECRFRASFCHEHRLRISLPWLPCRTPEVFIALLCCSVARLFFCEASPEGSVLRTRRSVAEASGGLSRTSSFHQHPHQVAFLHDHVLDAVELDFGPRPLAEQHPVADLDVDRDELAALIATAGADGNDLPFLRFFLRGIRDDDAVPCLWSSFSPFNLSKALQGTDDPALVTTARLKANRRDCERAQPCDQLGPAGCVVTHRKEPPLRQHHHVQAVLRHVDTAKREHGHLRIPSLLMRARALATVRVWKKRPEHQAHSRSDIRGACGLPVATGAEL